MPELMEGSQAVAKAIAMCRPGVVCAYPISPQTHIVEAFARLTRTGELKDCKYINVESEFAAMSVAIGSSMGGARSYTATASQGLLYMCEAVYNAAGLGVPIVMTIASRALGAPLNIWNDHSDSLSQRDSGWFQLFAMDNQEAADLHIQAFKIAEALSIPVMVCMDGFVLTHGSDVIDLPTQEQVDAFLPPFVPMHKLDVEHPTTYGMVGQPDTFTETKYLQYKAHEQAPQTIAEIGAQFERDFGRNSGGMLHTYGPETDGRGLVAHQIGTKLGSVAPLASDETAVIAMGSMLGTLQVVVNQMNREQGTKFRVVGVTSYRPFPIAPLRELVGHARQVVTFDRAVELGTGGVLSGDVRKALDGLGVAQHSVAAGLGGRAITQGSLADMLTRAQANELGDELVFMDLKTNVVEKVMA